MSLAEPATIGYVLAFAAFAVLTVRLTRQSGPRTVLRALWIASVSTALWSIAQLLHGLDRVPGPVLLTAVEWARNIAWLLVLVLAIGEIRSTSAEARHFSSMTVYSMLVIIVLAVLIAMSTATGAQFSAEQLASILFSIVVLSLCEQVLRNSPAQFGPVFSYICVTVGGIFLFELVRSLPFGFVARHGDGFHAAHGYAAAISALPLLVALGAPLAPVSTEPDERRFVFRSLVLITLTVSVLILLVLDHIVRALGGSWPTVARMALAVAVLCSIAVVSISPSVRGQLRVFLTKSFLRYKYDYRKEWLRFIGTLSETGLGHLPNTSVQAIARIVNSPAGVVWVVDADSRRYVPIGAWQHSLPLDKTFGADGSLVRFMVERQWVIDLSEKQRYPSLYGDLQLDPWFVEDERWWIIVPLLLGNDLYGFIALQHGPTFSSLNFEDHDLLRTVGRHVATHLKQAESDRQLSEAQQFSTYHRLSAFLMHDLNNLAAQLSLVVKNAEKHKEDPKFIEDMIATVANSATRMNRLLEQLSNVTEQSRAEDVDLATLLRRAIAQCLAWQPTPVLRPAVQELHVSADPERLCGVFEHLIRNAQDATDESGRIDIEIEQQDGWVFVRIRDTGCGMSEEFISERLFRPFDSTKGSQSMGIGAYQAREYVRMLGGQIDVASAPGAGTTFTIQLPTA